jgi:hypothetical protein
VADTFPERIAQAIGDPGSITARKLDSDGQPAEHLTRWQARAVLMVVSEHRWAPDTEPIGSPITAALLISFSILAALIAGLWLGTVWL